MKKYILTMLVSATLFATACKRQFEPINYGHEACTHCKMTIMDKRFAAEILTGKGRAIKFDDFGCLLQYIKDEHFNDPQALIYVADYDSHDGRFLDARQAVFLHNETLRSPMSGNLAAFSSVETANKLNPALQSKLLTFENLR